MADSDRPAQVDSPLDAGERAELEQLRRGGGCGLFTGPSVTAVRTRGAFVSGLGWLRDTGEHAGLRTGPVGAWTYTHRMGLRIGAAGLFALIFVFWGEPAAWW